MTSQDTPSQVKENPHSYKPKTLPTTPSLHKKKNTPAVSQAPITEKKEVISKIPFTEQNFKPLQAKILAHIPESVRSMIEENITFEQHHLIFKIQFPSHLERFEKEWKSTLQSQLQAHFQETVQVSAVLDTESKPLPTLNTNLDKFQYLKTQYPSLKDWEQEFGLKPKN